MTASLRIALAGALALTTLVSAGALTLGSLNDVEPGLAKGLPLASAKATAANRLLDEGWRQKSPALLEQAEQLARQELALAPASGEAWLRLAIIYTQIDGGLSGRAQTALRHSYDVAPLQTGLLRSRLRLAFNHWSELTPALREATLDQIEVAGGVAQDRSTLKEIVPTIENEGGRVAFAFKLVSIELNRRLTKSR